MKPCNWHLVLAGINHKSSTLSQREPLQLGHNDMAGAHAQIVALPGVFEATIVSTCNRVEFYFVADKSHKPFDIVRSFYTHFRGLDIAGLEDTFFILLDQHAADHLFRVTAGIDSMVLGENQIMGQVREAYSSACQVKAAGKIIHRLFHQAFRIGKQVRSDTELGQGACSVSSATVDMLKSKVKPAEHPLILFVGINKMINLAAQRLHRRGYHRFLFANRTGRKAVEFAAAYKTTGHSLEELPELIVKADVLISCTGADSPIITDRVIARRLATCPGHRLIIADMATPRDVKLSTDFEGVDLYDLDDVQRFVAEQQANRKNAIPQAEVLIDRKREQFVYWYEHIQHEDGYNGLGEEFEKIRREELETVKGELTPELREALEQATRRMTEKMLHVKMRATAQNTKLE